MTAQAQTQRGRPQIGRARLRKEDYRLITGQTNWTDNITLPGLLHVAFLRSPYAHARITQPTSAPPWASRASSPRTPARTSPPSRAACPAPGPSPPTS